MNTILVAIVTAVSTLLAVWLTGLVQTRNQRENHKFQLHREAAKHERDRADKEKKEIFERIIAVHNILSKIDREYSITNIVILRSADISRNEYDQRYLASCNELDEIRSFAAVYEPHLVEEIEKLCGRMEVFWGNFNTILYQTSLGNKDIHSSNYFLEAHEATSQVGKIVSSVKRQLAESAAAAQETGKWAEALERT